MATWTAVLLSVLVLGLPAAWAAESMMVESFDFADDAAAQAALRPSPGIGPAAVEPRGDGMALRIDCPFSREMERAYLDMDVDLDLSGYGRFTMETTSSDAAATGHFTLFFRSGQGWYGASVSPQPIWTTTTLTKADFRIEGTPTGWHAIDGIRLSQWRAAARDAYVLVDNLMAHSSDVAVVLSTQALAEGQDDGIRQFASIAAQFVRDAGVDVDVVTDEEVMAGALKGRRLAVFAYAPRVPDEVAAATAEFVAGGGKIFVCYTLDDRLGTLLGLRRSGWITARDGAKLDAISFDPGVVEGLPERVAQGSWNATVVEPTREDARPIGWWVGVDGERDGAAAVYLSDTGAFVGHVLTSADPQLKQQMLAALIGHFVEGVWESRAERALAFAGRVGPFASVGDLEVYVRAEAPDERATELLDTGLELLSAAQDNLAQGEALRASEQAAEARGLLARSYAAAQVSRPGEFRALWEHTASGLYPEEGWDASIARVADAGFNAIVPNMWWGGVASYDSKLLPHSGEFERYGDQVAQCVEAAHRRGVEVHAWKVNWNLANAPESFYQQMLAEGRTTMDVSGSPRRWLCPSHPANFELERNTMLEVALNYDVDGIHFDYIRYEGDEQCYCDGCRERFEAAAGVTVRDWPQDCFRGELRDAYRQFRCDQITRLVRAVSEEARAARPDIMISAAAFSDYPHTKVSIGQDWGLWVEEGWLDFVCPMDYTDSDYSFAGMVTRQLGVVDGRIPLYPGIGASAPGLPPDQVITQARMARELGTDGFIVFELSPETAADLLPQMREGFTAEDTFAPHNGPRIRFELPARTDPGIGAVLMGDAPQVVRAQVASYGTRHGDAVGLEGTVELRTTQGATIAVLGALPATVGETVEVIVEPAEGRLLLVAEGRLVLAGGERVPFVVRSAPLVFGQP